MKRDRIRSWVVPAAVAAWLNLSPGSALAAEQAAATVAVAVPAPAAAVPTAAPNRGSHDGPAPSTAAGAGPSRCPDDGARSTATCRRSSSASSETERAHHWLYVWSARRPEASGL
jgi:hypothetical protein